MKRIALIIGVVLLLGAIAAAIVPMWVSTAGMSLTGAGLGAVVFMIVGCFAVGGGLMFLIFYSARKGYDDDAYYGSKRREDPPHRPDGGTPRTPG
jgi:hypothetical protein